MALIKGNDLNNVLRGTSLADIIYGYGGADTIYGYDGDDRISGGTGNDVINAGAGDDRVNGGTGNDRIFGLGGNDFAGFPMICASLRVTDDDMARAGIGHHRGGYVARMRAGHFRVAGFPADHQGRICRSGRGARQQRCRYADQGFHARLRRGDTCSNRFDFRETCRNPVHLPVSGDKCPCHQRSLS